MNSLQRLTKRHPVSKTVPINREFVPKTNSPPVSEVLQNSKTKSFIQVENIIYYKKLLIENKSTYFYDMFTIIDLPV
jgi:hypothetical protein